jgi:Undecaprenyl-phosphate glucose phosphotransferase
MVTADSVVLARHLAFRLLDPFLLLAALLVAGRLRLGAWLPEQPQHQILMWLVVPATVVVFEFAGVYEGLNEQRLGRWCRRAVRGVIALSMGFLLVAYALKIGEEFSRSVILGWFVASMVVVVLLRVVVFQRIKSLHRHGRGIDRVVLVGGLVGCQLWRAHLEDHAELGQRVVAVASPDIAARSTEGDVEMVPIDDLTAAMRKHDAQRVVVCGSLGDQQLLASVCQQLLRLPVTLQYAPDLTMVPFLVFRAGDCAGRPLLDLSDNPLSERARVVKWIEDKVLASIILTLALPMLLIIGLLVKLTSPGPIFYIQDRHGLNGRRIRVLKFRTMTYRQPQRKSVVADVLASHQPATDVFVQASANDPRITRLGRLLRNTSLDEFPQFFNVLKGDMSVVGPRPHAVKHNEQFLETIDDLMCRHYVKPGITGLAQISGARGETRTVEDMRRRIGFDFAYIRNWSLWLDLKIIALTVIRGMVNFHP